MPIIVSAAGLPTEHQALMDVFYNYWNSPEGHDADGHSLSQAEISSRMPGKVNLAVMLGNYYYQVQNGGHMQWYDNGYSGTAHALLELFEHAGDIGIEGAASLQGIMAEFIVLRLAHEEAGDYDEDEDVGNPFSHLDDRLYKMDDVEAIMQIMLDRYDEIAEPRYASVMRRRAAA